MFLCFHLSSNEVSSYYIIVNFKCKIRKIREINLRTTLVSCSEIYFTKFTFKTYYLQQTIYILKMSFKDYTVESKLSNSCKTMKDLLTKRITTFFNK